MTTSVLFDHPGPRARRRNALWSAAFALAVVAALWWVLATLGGKHELDSAKWHPFATADVWRNFLLPGLLGTVKAAALSMVFALPLGVLLALGRLSDHAWLRWPATVVVEFFRAIPVLLLMFFAQAFYFTYTHVGSDSRPLFAVVTGLVLYNASVLCEIFRAGVLSLSRGQGEAAMAIGMRKGQMMRFVLLPQAVTMMLPAVISQLVVVLKDTALGGQLVGYVDLMRQANTLTANFSNSVATYTVIALLYVALNFLLSVLAGRLERWIRVRRGARPPRVGVPLPGGLAEGAAPGGANGPAGAEVAR